jgi:hypothetical protein
MFTPFNFSFAVRTTNQVPQAPKLASAVFSDDGSKVNFVFDSDTDLAFYFLTRSAASQSFVSSWSFPCNLVLIFTDSSSAKCSWSAESTRVLSVVSSGDGKAELSVQVGDTARLVAGTVRAACLSEISAAECGTYPAAPAIQITIQGPSIPAMPFASLLSAVSIGGCDSLGM